MLNRLEAQIVQAARAALEDHDSRCEQEPYVILLNPGNRELLGWDELLGLPVLSDKRVKPQTCRVVCGDQGWAGEHDGKIVYWLYGEPHELVEAI